MRTRGLRLLQSAATIGLPHAQSPLMTLTFEDFPPGRFGSYGPRHVTREEMLAFAAEFDPQPMHLDEEAAKRSMLKGLSGSGWHLCSIMMRMMCDGYIGNTASLGSPGVSELKWLAPLRPGDDLMLDVDVVEARVSRSRPQTGITATLSRTARPDALVPLARRETRECLAEDLRRLDPDEIYEEALQGIDKVQYA